MKKLITFLRLGLVLSLLILSQHSNAQTAAKFGEKEKVVIVTGVRFSYPLIQKWIDEYNQTHPTIQIVIEHRGNSDPSNYDILAEVYEHDEDTKKTREYVYVGRYAVLPVANVKSEFASRYKEKGLNRELIRQLFFEDLFSDNDKAEKIKAPYTVYTRLQKAGAPIVFTNYFGFEQKDIKGKAIAGSDQHLLKAVQRDTTAISYLPLGLIYNSASRKPESGLTVLPVDLNGNGKVSDDEKIFEDLDKVLERLERADRNEIQNVPLGQLHLSINKQSASNDAVDFLRWIIANGQRDLHSFGFLLPEASTNVNNRFEQFASKRDKK